ncbi:hypothetical protein KC316_g7380 [Hortaea werneckii]|nr:hypothetical protein KC316_g7380 [Hortaea werneckii]
MRPRERAIRDQLKMVADVCREAGVACLMNGDVYSRDEALELISEYGCDGAMIATAAETNPSVFRPGSEGGTAPWQEMIKEYVKTAMEVENRWGNTKYLLGQMIPGKQDAYKAMTHTKSYTELVRALKYDDLMEMAKDVDKALEIGEYEKLKMTKSERKAANKAAAKKAEEEKSTSTEQNDMQKTAAGIKRNAEMAELDMPPDVSRESGPASVPEKASALAV